MIQLVKNYVSRYVLFLEHIPFFFIPSSSHNLAKSNLIHINPFFDDQDNLSPIPNPANIGIPFPDAPNNIGTQVPDVPDKSSLLMAFQPPNEIDDPLSHYPKRACKSTQLPDFSYSCYSSYFTSFLAFIHHLSEPLSYGEEILNLFHNRLCLRNSL